MDVSFKNKQKCVQNSIFSFDKNIEGNRQRKHFPRTKQSCIQILEYIAIISRKIMLFCFVFLQP